MDFRFLNLSLSLSLLLLLLFPIFTELFDNFHFSFRFHFIDFIFSNFLFIPSKYNLTFILSLDMTDPLFHLTLNFSV